MRCLVAAILLAVASLAGAGDTAIQSVRTWAGPDHTRVVFDLAAPVGHRLFTLKDPHRVVLDLKSAELDDSVIESVDTGGVLQSVRHGQRPSGDLRVVLDLDRRVNPQSFLLRPNDQYGHRLVVDLEKPNAGNAPVKTAPENRENLLIAIDAGHGGEDPGAVGKRGTHEKDIVLSVARRLAKLIEDQPGMEPVLIRDGDYYVGLRERTRMAREARADMFVSLHADAFRDRRVSGSSVYVLSEGGASSETARVLAASENESDRIGGVTLDGKDELVASVLVDLSRAATIEASNALADTLIGELGRVGEVHRKGVERAGFVVLKSLDMPSVLVELAFLSNPSEERKLRDVDYQWQLARSLHRGLVEYADANLQPMKVAGGTEYVVRRGDTLSEIARNYGVSVGALRRANEIPDDTIMVGSRLRIP